MDKLSNEDKILFSMYIRHLKDKSKLTEEDHLFIKNAVINVDLLLSFIQFITKDFNTQSKKRRS